VIKSIALPILIAFLSACSGGGSDTETTVVIQTEPLCNSIYYGDSIGRQLEESQYRPDFTYDTHPGRKMIDIKFDADYIGGIREGWQTVIDYSFCNIYIALGTNDHDDVEASELKLIQLLHGHQDQIICVMPMTRKGVELPMRDIMLRECQTIIDPIAFGVYPLDEDEIHLSKTDGGENIKHYASIF